MPIATRIHVVMSDLFLDGGDCLEALCAARTAVEVVRRVALDVLDDAPATGLDQRGVSAQVPRPRVVLVVPVGVLGGGRGEDQLAAGQRPDESVRVNKGFD